MNRASASDTETRLSPSGFWFGNTEDVIILVGIKAVKIFIVLLFIRVDINIVGKTNEILCLLH